MFAVVPRSFVFFCWTVAGIIVVVSSGALFANRGIGLGVACLAVGLCFFGGGIWGLSGGMGRLEDRIRERRWQREERTARCNECAIINNPPQQDSQTSEPSRQIPTVICRECGAKNPRTATFCGNCGKTLIDASTELTVAELAPESDSNPTVTGDSARLTQAAHASQPMQVVQPMNRNLLTGLAVACVILTVISIVLAIALYQKPRFVPTRSGSPLLMFDNNTAQACWSGPGPGSVELPPGYKAESGIFKELGVSPVFQLTPGTAPSGIPYCKDLR